MLAHVESMVGRSGKRFRRSEGRWIKGYDEVVDSGAFKKDVVNGDRPGFCLAQGIAGYKD